MTTLTLLTKIYNANQLKQIDKTLKLSFEGLDVETQILGTVVDGWVQVALSGEDEGIATSYLTKNMGLCPTSLDSVNKFSALKGYVTNLEKSSGRVIVGRGSFPTEKCSRNHTFASFAGSACGRKENGSQETG